MASKVQYVFWLHVMKIKFSITHAGGSTAEESGVSGHSEHWVSLGWFSIQSIPQSSR